MAFLKAVLNCPQALQSEAVAWYASPSPTLTTSLRLLRKAGRGGGVARSDAGSILQMVTMCCSLKLWEMLLNSLQLMTASSHLLYGGEDRRKIASHQPLLHPFELRLR